MRLIDVYAGGQPAPHIVQFLYDLLAQRPEAANISHGEMPSFEKHRGFVTSRPYRFWYLIEDEIGGPPAIVGTICATHGNELGVAISSACQRRGLATQALRLFLEKHRPNPAQPSVRVGRWLANIAPGNEGSKLLFRGLGFRFIQETYELREENHGN